VNKEALAHWGLLAPKIKKKLLYLSAQGAVFMEFSNGGI
jgi:hypothetical protein